MKSKIVFILCSLLFVLSSCKSKQKLTEAVNTSQVESTYIHDKLTPVATRVDSARIKALFECDSTNKVILKQLFEVKGQNINTAFNYKDGLLDYSIRTGGDTVYIPGRDYYWIVHNKTIKTITITKTVTIPKTVKVPLRMTLLQKFQILCGNILIILILLIVGYYIVKYAIKIKLN